MYVCIPTIKNNCPKMAKDKSLTWWVLIILYNNDSSNH